MIGYPFNELPRLLLLPSARQDEARLAQVYSWNILCLMILFT
jgi:hypothetical protein